MARKSVTGPILEEVKRKKEEKKLAKRGLVLDPVTNEPKVPIGDLPTEEVKTLSPEQISKLLNDYTRRDPFNIKGTDPRFRYRFLTTKEDSLDRQTMRGWEIVTGPEAEKIANLSKFKTRGGKVMVQGLVLAKIPMELYIAIQARLRELSRRAVGASSNTLRRDMGSKYSRNVEESLKVRDGMKEQQVI